MMISHQHYQKTRHGRSLTLACVLMLSSAIWCTCDASDSVEEVPLAYVADGLGLVNGDIVTSGRHIDWNQSIVSTAEKPLRIELTAPVDAELILGPGSALRFIKDIKDNKDNEESDQSSLLVMLDRGTVQVDLNDRGPFKQLVLRGAATETVVLGTLFTAERISDQQDFVVLVRGAVKVRLRRDVAAALNIQSNEEIELAPRQGIAGSTTGGLGAVQFLSARPQLSGTKAQSQTTEEQATEIDEGEIADATWEQDIAAVELLNDEFIAIEPEEFIAQFTDTEPTLN